MHPKKVVITLVAIFAMALIGCGKKEQKAPAQPTPPLPELTELERREVQYKCDQIVDQVQKEKQRKLLDHEFASYKRDCKRMMQIMRLRKAILQNAAALNKVSKVIQETNESIKRTDEMIRRTDRLIESMPPRYRPPRYRLAPSETPPHPDHGTKGPPSEL